MNNKINLKKINTIKYIFLTFIILTFFASCTTPKKYTKTQKSIDEINKRKDLDCQKENIKRALELHKESVKLSKAGKTKKAELKDIEANALLKEIEKGCKEEDDKVVEDNTDKEDDDNFAPETKSIALEGNEDLKIEVVSDYTPEMIHFDFNSYKIKDDAKAILIKHVEYLSDKKNITIMIQGHTDSIGSEEYNLNLASKRAEIVRTFFKNQGVTLDTKIVPYGEELLLNKDITEADHYQNRRVEFKFFISKKK